MTTREGDEPDGLAAHEQKAWDAIVADLSGQVDLGPHFTPPAQTPPAEEQPHPDDVWLDEGYEPPEPPPIPRPTDVVGRASWAAVIGGPAIIIGNAVLGWDSWITWLGIAATVGGFASLIARMPSHRDEDDNGAVV